LIHKSSVEKELGFGTFEGTIYHILDGDTKVGIKSIYDFLGRNEGNPLKFTAVVEKEISKNKKAKLKADNTGKITGQLDYKMDKDWTLSIGTSLNASSLKDTSN